LNSSYTYSKTVYDFLWKLWDK